MNDNVDDVDFNELSVEHKDAAEQSVNFLQEMEDLNHKLKDPNYKTYKKSTYWHQQTTTMDEVKQEAFQKELIECLLRIETMLTKIHTLFEK